MTVPRGQEPRKEAPCRLESSGVDHTFGSDYGFPFQDGWVEIIASNREEADEIFMRHFPCRHPNTLNCSFVYTEAEWLEMDPARNWHGYKRYGTYTG